MSSETAVNTHIDLSSDQKGLSQVESYVQSVLDHFGVDEAHHGNILVAVSEACINAVKHGNQEDQSKTFMLGYSVEGKELHFHVEDQGSGFDFNNIPDPTAPENLEKETGRGIFLIKNLADGYEFSKAGRHLKISFFIL